MNHGTKDCPYCGGGGRCPECDGGLVDCTCECGDGHQSQCEECEGDDVCGVCIGSGKVPRTDKDVEDAGQLVLRQIAGTG